MPNDWDLGHACPLASVENSVELVLVLAIALSFLIISPVNAQNPHLGPTWSKTYQDVAFGPITVAATLDRGLVVGGHSGAGWIMRANLDGDPIWSRSLLPVGYSDADVTSIKQTHDGGYIVAGAAVPLGRSAVQAWLLKLDREGSVQWSKTFAGPAGREIFFESEQTFDDGYVVVGNTASFGYPPGHLDNGWIVRLDSSGTVVWQKALGGQDISSIEQTKDGGFIVSGTVGVEGSARAWVFKLNPHGNVVWEKAYGMDAYYNQAKSVEQTHDGGYVVAIAAGFLYPVALILRLNSKGDIIWQKTYSGGGSTTPVSISET